MTRYHFLHRLFSLILAVAMVLTPLAPVLHAQDGGNVFLPLIGSGGGGNAVASHDVLFRSEIAVQTPAQWARLDALGVTVLERRDDGATVLVDYEQLADLARLRFQPTHSVEYGALVSAGGELKPWLARSLQPLSDQAQSARAAITSPLAVLSAEVRTTSAELLSLRAVAQLLTTEQRAALASLPSLDDDGDGLTNTEEGWWCTDALNANSDGDAQGYSDGQEVAALLDVTQPRNVRWGYGAPFGPPNAWPNFNNRDGSGVNVCNDGDFDTIPDYAEVFMVGTRVPYESTDNDKFDDGQELFGVTYCPGAPTNCGYGSYPAVEYWNFIKATMPNWVLPPGDSPFVAAFPVPEVMVEANSWTVERVTTITTSQGEMVEQTNSYETAVTRGQSTSIANTVTWNEWEEVSQAVERPLARSGHSTRQIQACEPAGSMGCRIWGGAQIVAGVGIAAGAAVFCGGATAASLGIGAVPCLGIVAGAGAVGGAFVGEGWSDLTGPSSSPDNIQNNYYKTSNYNDFSYNPDYYDFSEEHNAYININQQLDSQGIVKSLDGVQYAINQQGQLLASGLQDISYQISRPRLTETKTNGKSWGGAQTTTHEVYEEHTISQGEAFTTGQNWSTAWAVDSSHAADLTFRYSVRNAGTEYARELSNLIFNIYIGDDKLPTISYAAWEQFANGKLDNLFPVGPNTPPGVVSTRTFASNAIPLSLEQMKRIDLGERLTVKVESFSFGADELFYSDAINGGVTVFIEDGVEDGDETVDQYVIPTWGAESVQDVLTRYFPHAEDADGNLNSLWTPEFNGIDAPTWHEHYLSDIAWWNVYLTQADAGDTPLHQLPARAGSGILFRFNRDSDRDGYNDRAEFRYYCALPAGHVDRPRCADGHLRPEIHPQPKVLAGYVVERSGNLATVKLALENTGTFDAYGIDAVMYSPDDTTTIGNNTVGGNGKVRPGNKVTVGSMVKAPDLSNWGASRARPYAAGEYSGAVDRTFTFTAQTPGVVGTGSTAVAWNDGSGASGVLQVGGSYHAPLPLDVAHGVQVGFNTGTIDAGARFTVQALTSRDTFTYTINSEPFTPPVIVVSYSDPQGSHRFVTPVQLPALGDSLAPHVDAMLEGLELKIVATAAFVADGANTTNLVVYNPHPATIRDGHLHLNFVSDGKLVLEKSHTLDIPAGPTTFAADWSVAEFSADYNPAGDNLLIAFWTDSENNIIDSAARPLHSFAADPKPAAASDAAAWDFGVVTQGEVLQRTVSLASVGDLDLLGYVHGAPGLSVSQTGSKPLGVGDVATYQLTLDTRTLPTGPYNGAVTLRTSDPAHPLYTVQVSGVIQAASGDAYARTVSDRPLDVEVWVPGNRTQGEWITFEHPLGPEPQSLHPVKVYSQDGATLYGVGKYATDFSAGTASYDMFGDGRDGVMPGSGNLDNNNGFGIGIVNSGAAGATSIDVTDAYAGWRINPGDVVLIHQTQGTGAGCWEMNKAVSDYAGGTAAIQLEKPLKCNYASGGNNHAQVLRVPQYSTCNVTGTVTPLYAWNGSTGGIFALMCSGTLTVASGARIDISGSGFRGGVGQGVNLGGQNGESTDGFVGRGGTSNGGYGTHGGGSGANNCCRSPAGLRSGGGGSGGYDYANDGQGDEGTGGGGGGGNATAGGGGGGGGDSNGVPADSRGGNGGSSGSTAGGGNGGNQSTNGGNGGDSSRGYTGSGGDSNGSSNRGTGGGGGGSAIGDDSSLLFGSGGGASGAYQGKGAGHHLGRNGGNGGGVGFISALSIQIAGTISSSGQNGQTTDGRAGSGGGGAGGSLLLRVQQLSAGSSLIQAFGGSGGPPSGAAGGGGQGGAGRVRVEYCESFTGSTNPSASTQKLNCYVTDQIELAPYTTTRFNLPENLTDGNAYRIQYARRLTLAAAGEITTTLRVPAGIWTAASLDALISGVGSGDVTFKLDVGADGVWDWEETRSVTNAATFSSPDLATAFAPYVNGAGQIDVPVTVSLSKPGQVLLTNMAVTRNRSVELAPAFTLSGSPTEGAVVPLNATVANSGAADSGPLTVSYYATQHATRNTPQYIGSVFVPNIAAGGAQPAPFNWNTLGFTGSVTVTAVVDPYNRIAESDKANNRAAAVVPILTRPDLAFTAVALSNAEPMVGEPVQVVATLANRGQTTAGSQATALYLDNPDGGGVLLQAQTVTSVGGGANRTVTFTWTPTAPGLHRLFLRSDRDNQVDEFDERNNDRWLDVYVGFASPLAIDSGSAGDTAYSAAQGYGAVDNGETDEIGNCGEAPYQRFRRDPSGRVVYRFDHLLPGHFYHLDLVLYECGQNAGRQQRVHVDGIEIAGPVDLGSGDVQNLSLLLDPALYADRSVEVAVTVDGSGGALVNQIALVDVDYRYADAGGARDVRYPTGARAYGWLDGVAQTPWGALPYRSLRENQSGSEVRYRFDALDPANNYQVHFSFFLGSGNNRVQQIWVDDIPLSGDFTLVAGQRNDQRVDLPKESYADGTITVAVRRADGAATGAMINEIALEELTQARAANCQVTATPSWSVAFGNVTVAGQPAPAGTVITAETPRGEVVGCYVVENTGQYGFMSVYGEDASSTPVIPGMRAGEPVVFRVNGVMAVPTPQFTWQDNKTRTSIDLAAGVTQSQYTLLRPNWNLLSTRMTPPVPLPEIVFRSIAGKYCLVLGARGVFDCNLPAGFQSLKEIAPGKAYYTRITGGASVNLVIEGVPQAADTPLALERGLNWVGYLPTAKQPVATALQSISGPLLQAADGQGRIYDPALPGFSTLLELLPGQGYLLHLREAATLVYPATAAAAADDAPLSTAEIEGTGTIHCGGVEPTPRFTAIYGALTVDGADAAVGSRVEAYTPRGEVAGCFTVTSAGQYGFLTVFGADNAENALPGFLDGEPVEVRVDGVTVALDAPLTWQDDKSTHRLNLEIAAPEEPEQPDQPDRPAIYLPLVGR